MIPSSKYVLMCWMGMVVLSFPSCTGILGGIYDQPPKLETGFLEVNGDVGQVALDVTNYDEWHYISFQSRQVVKTSIPYDKPSDNEVTNVTNKGLNSVTNKGLNSDFNEPRVWEIAIHRHDVKTNDGAILKTQFENFDELKALASAPEGEYVKDIEPCSIEDLQKEETQGRIEVDMSAMMDGNIIYVPSSKNMIIDDWVVRYGGMPPSFQYSPNVYLVRMPDGKYIGLKIRAYVTKTMDIAVDGELKRLPRKILTFDYCYPVSFGGQ